MRGLTVFAGNLFAGAIEGCAAENPVVSAAICRVQR
jgi:hypothetical protein